MNGGGGNSVLRVLRCRAPPDMAAVTGRTSMEGLLCAGIGSKTGPPENVVRTAGTRNATQCATVSDFRSLSLPLSRARFAGDIAAFHESIGATTQKSFRSYLVAVIDFPTGTQIFGGILADVVHVCVCM